MGCPEPWDCLELLIKWPQRIWSLGTGSRCAGRGRELLDGYEEEGLEELKRQTGKRTKQVKKDKRRSSKEVSSPDPGYMKQRQPLHPGPNDCR